MKGNPRTHHVHMNERGSPDWEKLLFLRDYLVQHPEVAKEYAILNATLAQQFPDDREAYTDGKSPFIEQVLRQARSEGGSTSADFCQSRRRDAYGGRC